MFDRLSTALGGVIRTLRVRPAAVAALLAVVGVAVAAPATATEGPLRWDRAVVTVAVADEEAWAGTDVEAALAQWSPAVALVLVEGGADVVLTVGIEGGEGGEGAVATTTSHGSTIDGCRIALADGLAGTDATAILTHETGHCLGLGHSLEGPSVMWWFGGDYAGGWSDTVTERDLAAVRTLYR